MYYHDYLPDLSAAITRDRLDRTARAGLHADSADVGSIDRPRLSPTEHLELHRPRTLARRRRGERRLRFGRRRRT